jgi:hypothetical protein
MINRMTFEFLPEQEAIFQARHKRPPNSGELDDLRGPVLMVDIRHTPPTGGQQISLPPAVALIDTGADLTCIELELITRAYQAAKLSLPAQSWMPFAAGVFKTNHFAIEVNGVRIPTRSGLIELRPRHSMPGYEEVLIGRDLLATLTLCCSTDVFSLFSLMNSAPIPIRLPPDPCCR